MPTSGPDRVFSSGVFLLSVVTFLDYRNNSVQGVMKICGSIVIILYYMKCFFFQSYVVCHSVEVGTFSTPSL